jgi:tetratricopeptide (TPR) repeat protein
VWGGLALAITAHAGAPPALPSYREALIQRTWHQLNDRLEQLCRYDVNAQAVVCSQDPKPLLDHARSFQKNVTPDAGLAYLIGLGERYRGQEDLARRHYREALDLDPTYTAAWHDLGELHLISGHIDLAQEAFSHVAVLHDTGPNCWIGPWRLAEVAAHRLDAQEFETQLREALRRGFSFRQIDGLPNWRTFYLDPSLQQVIDKLVRVYGTKETLDSLRP